MPRRGGKNKSDHKSEVKSRATYRRRSDAEREEVQIERPKNEIPMKYKPKAVDWDQFYDTSVNVVYGISGKTVKVEPFKQFSQLKLPKPVMKRLMGGGSYRKPTPIQRYTFPLIDRGEDVMGCAQTGTGKTASFVLPLIKSMYSSKPTKPVEGTVFPEAVIVTPTRELAMQIFKDVEFFSSGSTCKMSVVYGGQKVDKQRRSVMKGSNLLVATPGRLKHFILEGTASLEKVRFFVLDEADKMLDMGFKPDIERFAEFMPPTEDRQTLMFSATYPDGVHQIARLFLREDYLFVSVGEIGSAQPSITQYFHLVEAASQKPWHALNVVQDILGDQGNKVLVFVETKIGCEALKHFLSDRLDVDFDPVNPCVDSLHSDMTQHAREITLKSFKEGDVTVLVATAVAARGLDISGVTHVINYDLPSTPNKSKHAIEEYINKIGRTGRGGESGVAISFYQPDRDVRLALPLVYILSVAHQEIPEWLLEIARKQPGAKMVAKSRMRIDQAFVDSEKKVKDKIAEKAETKMAQAAVVQEGWDKKMGPGEEELWGAHEE